MNGYLILQICPFQGLSMKPTKIFVFTGPRAANFISGSYDSQDTLESERNRGRICDEGLRFSTDHGPRKSDITFISERITEYLSSSLSDVICVDCPPPNSLKKTKSQKNSAVISSSTETNALSATLSCLVGIMSFHSSDKHLPTAGPHIPHMPSKSAVYAPTKQVPQIPFITCLMGAPCCDSHGENRNM